MKRLLVTGCAILVINLLQAQQKEGKVTYARTSQMQISLQGMNDEMERNIPKTRTDNFELTFANNQTLWKQAEQDNDDGPTFGGEGMQIRMVVAGSDDVLYTDLGAARKVELRIVLDKKFIVDDSVRPLKWKMSEETKTILNHLCHKATTVRYGKRTTMNIDNGKMERKEVEDTSNIVAWFTTDIPVSSGPGEFQGQLPGLILAMDIKDGRQTFMAKEISAKADLSVIKEPKGKKHYTLDEFNKERDKMMEEMQRNNGGGN
ncbi:MAG: GLPGLI family protein, partial [Bacteroidia bacterium]|nr:GLPGLI family protein [Bacteroidia bacterium]